VRSIRIANIKLKSYAFFITVSVHITYHCYNKERLFLHTTLIDGSFVILAHCALLEVRTESFHIRWTIIIIIIITIIIIIKVKSLTL
jgi:hypothetical protein